jgi:cytochrome c oxidase assembly factor CtaG
VTQKIDVQKQARVTAQGSGWVTPMFVAGLVLLLAGPWFTGQRTVGLILLCCSLAPLAIFLTFVVAVLVVLAVVAIADDVERHRRLRRRAAERGRSQR